MWNDLKNAGLNGWQPVLEILILAVGIYFTLRFIRGTRGAPIVTGFLVLLLTLVMVTFFLNLVVLRWILLAFSSFLAVAIVVLFQPEIRRMLGELGNLPLFATAHEQRESIEVIIQTVERLADVKIGALIAIEQSIQLQEAVESGIVVDCAATPEMLETIFFPNNAIHDGGVIIKGDRIVYAACIFPLTQRKDLNKSLGTRHRAAIGLSEETDAVIVVVSEETGTISHVYKGQLVRGISLEQLRAFLSSVLLQSAKSRNRMDALRSGIRKRLKRAPVTECRERRFTFSWQMISTVRDIFFRDFWLKLFSLIVAVLIWLVVWRVAIRKDVSPLALSARSEEHVFHNIPVLVMSAAADVRDFKVSPNEVTIKVRGEPQKLEALENKLREDPQAKDIRALVDLTGIEPVQGMKKKITVTTPPDITFELVEPDQVEIIKPTKR